MNTGILYSRMLLTIGISFYTTRIVLNSLGSEDFGIYSLVAGIIAMLSFLNDAMATSTQRFLSYYQGKRNKEILEKVFTNSLLVHILIGLILVVLLEIIGLIIFNDFLNINENRIKEAKIIYHFMSLTVFFTVLTVPFTASLIAHENMLFVAIVNIIEVILKLIIAIFLVKINIDKLIFYGVCTSMITIITFILYSKYCLKKYQECKLRILKNIEKKLIKELTAFAGWNLFGTLCSIGRNQGLAIVLNLFNGTKINAAYGISNQVSGQIVSFSSMILRAINPQIMKSEGSGEREKMLSLALIACKFGFLLLALIAIPCIFEMESILQFWLKNVPKYTTSFCSLLLISMLIRQLTIGIQSALQASGKIKNYQSVVGTLILTTPVVSYIFLHIGFYPVTVFVCHIIIEIIATILRLYYAKNTVNLVLRNYYKNVIQGVIVPVIISIITCLAVQKSNEYVYRPLITIFISSISISICIYFFSLSNYEKNIIIKLKNKILSRPIFKQNISRNIELNKS